MLVVRALAQSFFKMDSQSPKHPELSHQQSKDMQPYRKNVLE